MAALWIGILFVWMHSGHISWFGHPSQTKQNLTMIPVLTDDLHVVRGGKTVFASVQIVFAPVSVDILLLTLMRIESLNGSGTESILVMVTFSESA